MTVEYAEYNGTTGEILNWGAIDPVSVANQAGYIYVGHVDNKTQYIQVSNGALIARPAFPSTFNTLNVTADGSSSATITGLPNPTTITFMKQEAPGVTLPSAFDVTDGSLTLTVKALGFYQIKLTSFPYQDYIVTLTAN